MKYYQLSMYSSFDNINKNFSSREEANKYMEKILYNRRYQVDEIIRKDKHEYEYICENGVRFYINRVIL